MIIATCVHRMNVLDARTVISNCQMAVNVFHVVQNTRTAAYVIPVHARHVMKDIIPPVRNVDCV